jgi:AcrR family transcriptional regulator
VRAHAQARSPAISLILKPEPGTRDRLRRRAALIDAANEAFAQRGFDATTTREIAERAGCAEGLIHRYFNGKRGLLLAILESKAAHIVEEFEADLPDRPTVLEEIERILLRDLDLFWERRDYMRVAVSQAAIDPEIGHAIGANINQQRVRMIRRKLQRHQEAGRIAPGVDLEGVAYSISALGFSVGFVYQACFGDERLLARRIISAGAKAIAAGITPGSPGSERTKS